MGMNAIFSLRFRIAANLEAWSMEKSPEYFLIFSGIQNDF